jgi:3-methyladenine DNA glycosylase Mpg
MALGIGKSDHGKCLNGGSSGFFSVPDSGETVVADRRVGISRARDLPWRFLEKDNQHVSVAFGKAK